MKKVVGSRIWSGKLELQLLLLDFMIKVFFI
nr:hypothetical protein [Tanacetum cinerariifolium]